MGRETSGGLIDQLTHVCGQGSFDDTLGGWVGETGQKEQKEVKKENGIENIGRQTRERKGKEKAQTELRQGNLNSGGRKELESVNRLLETLG
mmetsp:Transcript_26139/g.51332  ORF Transcript_26139/g.51332 Transcript_26139/m.51332 type:complete len:92 (-) Transcript_26139:721-996(-)